MIIQNTPPSPSNATNIHSDKSSQMKVAIHQPDYIPWIGLFYKMYLCDVFIHLDDAQYSNAADHNVNSIKTPQGAFRLKFPVEQHLGDLINQVRPKYELKWREKHVKTLEMNYSKALHFKSTFPELKELLMSTYTDVAELNITINEFIARKFGISAKFIRSSSLMLKTVREEKVIDLTLAVGGTRYISGNGARAYQVESNFIKKGIDLQYIDYKPISYPQLWKTFLPCMSVIDYIFNCGYDFEYVLNEVQRLNRV